jgi:3-oxoadipate enol-lactonase
MSGKRDAMREMGIDGTLPMYYEDNCFADPWLTPEVMVLIHGVAESGLVWYGWMPQMARRFRVIRPDLRGFGRSTVASADYPWSTQSFGEDIRILLDKLQVDKAHVVGAKFGGSVAVQFAADNPDRVQTLSLMGPLIKGSNTGSRVEVSSFTSVLENRGHQGFAEDSQRLRLGSTASEEQVAWWNRLMGSSDERVAGAVLRAGGGLDLTDTLPQIQAPTLVITTDRNPIHGLEWVVQWQRRLPDSELLVLPGDGYHIAASSPEVCAQQVVEFIDRVRARKADPEAAGSGSAHA